MDLAIGVAGFVQYPLAVLADIGGAVRLHLVLALDPYRAVDRHRLAIGERHQRLACQHLGIVGNVLHLGNYAEDDPGSIEDGSPLGEILCRKHIVEDPDQFARIGLAPPMRRKARIAENSRSEALLEFFPAPFVGRDRQQQPMAIAAPVMNSEGIEAALARRLWRDLLAAQR